MKKIILFVAVLIATGVSAQLKTPKALSSIGKANQGAPSANEINSALKETLEKGISQSTGRLSATGGFLQDPSIKILFPPEALKAEATLRNLGYNQLCDNFISSVNATAELCAKEAKTVFIAALSDMSFSDSNAVLYGSNDAATLYFKTADTAGLSAQMFPVIIRNLEKTGASGYWANIVAQHNKIPMATKLNSDLTAYVTGKFIEAMFNGIAKEELGIRSNEQYRTSALLQKVFAYAAANKPKG